MPAGAVQDRSNPVLEVAVRVTDGVPDAVGVPVWNTGSELPACPEFSERTSK